MAENKIDKMYDEVAKTLPVVPDKIDVKIGSKVENEWTKIVEREEEALIKHRINVEITENLLILAKKRAQEEHDKFNKK